MATQTLDLPAGQRADRATRLRLSRAAGLVLGLIGVLLVTVLSLRIGSLPVSNDDAWNALVSFNPDSYEQTVVRALRVPRTAVGLAIGASLAVAGAVMQGITRNPLANSSSASAAAPASPL